MPKTKTLLNADQIDTLNDILDQFDTRLRSYSGRCMYGAECVGADLNDDGEIARFFFALGRADMDEEVLAALSRRSGIKTDSMGRGLIVYWPDVYVADAALLRDDDEEDDEEDEAEERS